MTIDQRPRSKLRGITKFNFAEIRESVANLYNHLHGSLTNRELGRFAGESGGSSAISDSANADPRFGEWLHLKAALSVDLLRSWREVIDEFSGERKELLANAFMPPFSTITGFDFSGASRYCDALSPKLYTMHWSAIVEFWGSVLLNHNPDLDESLLVQTLARLFDLDDEHASRKLSYYRYPKPTEPHPISSEIQSRKIDEVISRVNGQTAVGSRLRQTAVSGGGDTDRSRMLRPIRRLLSKISICDFFTVANSQNADRRCLD